MTSTVNARHIEPEFRECLKRIPAEPGSKRTEMIAKCYENLSEQIKSLDSQHFKKSLRSWSTYDIERLTALVFAADAYRTGRETAKPSLEKLTELAYKHFHTCTGSKAECLEQLSGDFKTAKRLYPQMDPSASVNGRPSLWEVAEHYLAGKEVAEQKFS